MKIHKTNDEIMNTILKELLDNLNTDGLKEVKDYITSLIKNNKDKNKPSLDEVMSKMFEKYPGTKYFDFGYYGKGDYECSGECYSGDGEFDYEDTFLENKNEEFEKDLPEYWKRENWLNASMYGNGDKKDFDKYDREYEEIKKAKGIPKINDHKAFDFPNGVVEHVIYVKDRGLIYV